jgi:hypothetical protein
LASATVRISQSARDTLRDLAAKSGESMQTVLEQAIEELRRRRFLEETNAAYAALRQNDEDWESLHEERAAWDATLLDGLEPDQHSPFDDPRKTSGEAGG